MRRTAQRTTISFIKFSLSTTTCTFKEKYPFLFLNTSAFGPPKNFIICYNAIYIINVNIFFLFLISTYLRIEFLYEYSRLPLKLVEIELNCKIFSLFHFAVLAVLGIFIYRCLRPAIANMTFEIIFPAVLLCIPPKSPKVT